MTEQGCEQLTFFQAGSPVNRSPSPGSEEARRMTVTSGRKCLELSKSCGLLGLLEKTLLESSIWRSTRCYLTWRPKATKQRRLLFQLAVSMPRTAETGSQLWLGTMTASQTGGNHSLRSPERMKGRTPSPAEFVMMWPTPRAKESGGLSVQCRESRQANTDALRRGKIVDNSYSRRFGRHIWREQFAQPKDGCWWPIEPDVGRVAHGIPHRVDRLRCLGNAVVPAQFYPIFKGIAELFGREVQK